MATRLILIRHSESRVDPVESPSTWELTDVGQARARTLAGASFRRDLIAVAAGDEPKMVETIEPLAQAAGLAITTSAYFRESHADGWLDDHEFRAVIAAFFEHPSIAPAPAWEPADTAARRFMHALDQLLDRHQGPGNVAVCSGGRALTAVLGAMGLVPREALFETWQSIRMPDAAVIELGNANGPILVRPFGDDAPM